MAKYEIVAFYKHKEAEVADHAGKLSSIFGLDLRYEKVPRSASAIAAILNEKSVICIFNWDFFGKYSLMKYVYHLPRPSIVVRTNWPLTSYMHLKVPVGYLQENKEKVVWANFLQKNNPDMDIELLVPTETDAGIVSMVSDNLFFFRKILTASGAHFVEKVTQDGTGKSLQEAFRTTDDGMVVIMRPFRIFSFYYPFRLRQFLKYGHTPVLIIPRDDELYIPCH